MPSPFARNSPSRDQPSPSTSVRWSEEKNFSGTIQNRRRLRVQADSRNRSVDSFPDIASQLLDAKCREEPLQDGFVVYDFGPTDNRYRSNIDLPCLIRYRGANPFERASIFQSCQNLLSAARPRVRGRIDRMAFRCRERTPGSPEYPPTRIGRSSTDRCWTRCFGSRPYRRRCAGHKPD